MPINSARRTHLPCASAFACCVGLAAPLLVSGCAQTTRNEASAAAEVAGEPNAVSPIAPATGGNQALPIVQQPSAAQPVATTPAPLGGPVRLSGRFDTSDANNALWSWPASEVVLGFSGSGLTMRVSAQTQKTYGNIGNVDNYLDIFVDGSFRATARITQNTKSVPIATGLGDGNHVAIVRKRTEAQIGTLGFAGVAYADGGGPAPTPAAPTRRIEIVGDSAAVGYGADANVSYDNMCAFTPQTENAGVAYGAIAAKWLGAEHHNTGNSGKGILQNRDPVNDAVNTLPVMWTWTVGDNRLSQPDYKPSAWPADVVVVVVGGNDFAVTNADGSSGYAPPPAAAFNTAATNFLRTLRAAYPAAWLFLVNSPMLDPAVQTAGEAYAQAAIASFGDRKSAFLKLMYDDGSRGFGCDYHLNAATHALVGKQLAGLIAAKTGWTLAAGI